jgi:hypothetical protein
MKKWHRNIYRMQIKFIPWDVRYSVLHDEVCQLLRHSNRLVCDPSGNSRSRLQQAIYGRLYKNGLKNYLFCFAIYISYPVRNKSIPKIHFNLGINIPVSYIFVSICYRFFFGGVGLTSPGTAATSGLLYSYAIDYKENNIMNVAVFTDVTPSSVVEIYCHFGRMHCLYLKGRKIKRVSALKMEAVDYFETFYSKRLKLKKKLNSVAYSPQANYTDRAAAAC